MTVVIGIDPGVTGAYAIHENGELAHVEDLPVFDGRVDGKGLYGVLSSFNPYNTIVYVENTQAMPKNGSIASYSLGLNTGIIVGVVQSASHPLVRVRPPKWKAKMGVTRLDKNAIRGIVRELYPSWADTFARVKDHNRAEAVLISRYGVSELVLGANSAN